MQYPTPSAAGDSAVMLVQEIVSQKIPSGPKDVKVLKVPEVQTVSKDEEGAKVKEIFIIKFMVLDDSDASKRKSTTKHMSKKTLDAIPIFRERLRGGVHFKDALKPSPATNTVDLTAYDVHLKDLITYFLIKKELRKGNKITPAHLSLLIRPTPSLEDTSTSTSPSSSSATSSTSSTSSTPSTSSTVDLTGFFRLADSLIDHEMVKIAAKFATEYKDLGFLSEELLSQIASDYLHEIFEAAPYRETLKEVKNQLSLFYKVFERFLCSSLLQSGYTPDPYFGRNTATLLSENLDTLLSEMDLICKIALPDAIDKLIRVIREQYKVNTIRRAKEKMDTKLFRYSLNRYYRSHYYDGPSRQISDLCNEFFLPSKERHPEEQSADLKRKPHELDWRLRSKKEHNSSVYLFDNELPKLSFLIDEYISKLILAKRKIDAIFDLIPSCAFSPRPAADSNDDDGSDDDDDDDGSDDDHQRMKKNRSLENMDSIYEVDAALDYLYVTLKDANEIFAPVNVFDPNMNVVQRVIRFVNESPAVAKLIWETESFRKLLVGAYMKIPVRKIKRFMNSAFEELIALVEGRIDGSSPDLALSTPLSKIIWSDQELKRLYKRYNSIEYRMSQIEIDEGVDLVWIKIQERTRYLINKYQADKQKNAPRGPMKHGWYM